MYVADSNNKRVLVRRKDSFTVTKTTFNSFSPISIFVTIDGNVFAGFDRGSVEKWTSTKTGSVVVMTFSSRCSGLFIDIDNNLYCSMSNENHVVKRSLDVNVTMSTMVAGTGIRGSTSDTLDFPHGIFIDVNFNLYVADYWNNRVQLFKVGQSNGTTVAGSAGMFRVTLHRPTSVFLDANNNLFVVDSESHRIIRASLSGFNCVMGCSGVSGEASNQLFSPTTAAFDSFGNILVADSENRRVQKFILMTNDFGK